MVNPLVRAGYKTAVQPSYPGNVPQPLTPEQHDVWEETHNIPYRGAVDHGMTHGESVPTDLRKTILNESINTADDTDQDVEPEPITPVPVYIMRQDDPGKELRMFRTSRGYASQVAQRLLSRSDGRSKGSVKNLGRSAVWVGHDQSSANPWNGYRLDPGSEFTTSSDQEVWCVADPSASAVQGGWQQVMASQTINGATVVNGAPFNVPDGVMPRVVMRVTGASGTTPTVVGTFQVADQTGAGVGTMATTSARTTVGSVTTIASAVGTDKAVPVLNTTGASGDSAITAELWAYLGTANPAVDNVPLAINVEFSAVNP